METKYQVVVIGAGLGGLSAAAYLAKAGKKVLVLEHHTVPGGYAHEFRRGKYRFDVALHAMDGVGPGGWAYEPMKDLQVMDQVRFHRLDPFYTASFPKHDVTAHADLIKYEAELVKHFPHEREGIHAIVADMVETYWQVRRFGAENELGIRAPIEQIPTLFPKMLAAMSMSWDEYMNHFLHDAELKAVFSTIWGYFGLPPEKLNAATMIFPWVSYMLIGAYYPEGGSFAISRAIENTLKKYGGEIRYRQTVKRIEIKDGRAVAVETEQGLRVEADIIISNANSPDTMLKFIGREYLSSDYVQKIQEDKPATSNLVVYLGLDNDLRAEGWDYHERFIAPSYDINQCYNSALKGDFANASMAITLYNIADPDCAPAGGSVLNLFSLADWNSDNQWGTGGNLQDYSNNPQYNELKNAGANILIDRAEKFIPGLRKHIKYIEVATPITNWRYTLNVGGSIYGTEQSLENTFLNRLPATTPIANVFLTGAWTFGGGMSAAMLSGHDTSQTALEYMDGTKAVLANTQINVPATDVHPELPASQPTPVQPSASVAQNSLPALAVTLQSAGSGRRITLNAIGKPAVLLFHTQDTAEQAAKINQAVRSLDRYRDPSHLLIANVVDLHAVPKLFRNIAEKAMKDSYKQAVAALPQGSCAEDNVIILPDWDGRITKSLELQDVSKNAGVVVLNTNGCIAGKYQGSDSKSQVLSLLEKTL
jgi:prolycopene isomerase